MATKKPPVTRLRDLEEDVFDVAHNNLLRTATELPITGRRLMVNATDWEAKPEEAGQSAEGTKVLMCADTTAACTLQCVCHCAGWNSGAVGKERVGGGL